MQRGDRINFPYVYGNGCSAPENHSPFPIYVVFLDNAPGMNSTTSQPTETSVPLLFRRHARVKALGLAIVVVFTISVITRHLPSVSRLEDLTSQHPEVEYPAESDSTDFIDLPEPISHSYEKNGLLTTNPDAPHPIHELVREAEALWRAKLRRASTTLEQAVMEYRIRYRRSPPKGFDHW